MKRFGFFSLAVAALAVALPSFAIAAPPKSLGKYGYWAAYQMSEGQDPVCYMTLTAKPPKPKKAKIKRGDVVIMITQRPAENTFDIFSYASGLKFRASSDVTVKIGDKSFNLFTQAETAWSRDSLTDKDLTAALREAPSMTVNGTAANGDPIADTVSLKGAAEAYYAIGKACGMNVSPPKKAESPKKAPAKTNKASVKKHMKKRF